MATALQSLGKNISTGEAPQSLSPEKELELIRRVQQDRDSEAFEELAQGYTRGLRSCLRGFTGGKDMDVNDAWSEILVGFYENVMAYDLEGDTTYRLSYGVKSLRYRISALRDEDTNSIRIEPRALRRYRALHKRYDGDLMQMFTHAPEEGLSKEHLMDIHAVLTSESLNEIAECGEDAVEPLEMYGPGDDAADLIALAFASIGDDSRATGVVWHTYNFDEPTLKRRRTDGDVAELMDLSRAVVQRCKAGALQRMRGVLLHDQSDEGIPGV